MSLAPMEDFSQHRVCKMLMNKCLLSAERVKMIESWEHSGFNIGAEDATGRGNWARFIKKVFELDPLLPGLL